MRGINAPGVGFNDLATQTPESAALELSYNTSIGPQMAAIGEMLSNADKNIKNHVELNQMFPEAPEKFSESMSVDQARYLVERQMVKKDLEQNIAKGGGGVGPFAASALGGLLDPVGNTIGLFAGPAFKAAGIVGTTLAGRIGVNIAENFIGNSIADAASYKTSQMLQDEYDAAERIKANLAGSVLLGGAMGTLSHIFRESPKLGEKLYDSAESRGATGLDPEKVRDVYNAHIAAENSGTHFPYEHGPFDQEGKFYSASPTYNEDFSSAEHAIRDSQAGHEKGLQLFSNENIAHAAALTEGSGKTGIVFEHNIADKNLVDGNKPLKDIEPRPVEYKFSQLDPSKGVKGKLFFHGSTGPELQKLSEAQPNATSNVRNLYGEGLYLTDNPKVAESYVKRGGKVHAATLGDLKLLDLEKPLPEKVLNIFNDYLDKYGGDLFKSDSKVLGKDIFQALRTALENGEVTTGEALEVLQNLSIDLQKEGYHGLYHIGGRAVGGLGDHNVAILFDRYDGNNMTGLLKDAAIPNNRAIDPVDMVEKAMNRGKAFEAGFTEPVVKVKDMTVAGAYREILKAYHAGVLSLDHVLTFEKAIGGDGIHFEMNDFRGQEQAPTHGVYLFDREGLQPQGFKPAEEQAVGKLTPDRIQMTIKGDDGNDRIFNYEKGYNKKGEQMWLEMKDRALKVDDKQMELPLDTAETKVDNSFNEAKKRIQARDQFEGHVEPETKAALEKAEESFKEANKLSKIYETISACLR